MCVGALCTQEQCADSSGGSGDLGDVVTPGPKGILPRLALHWEYMPTPVEPGGGGGGAPCAK